jgi:aminopeptidase N
LADCALQIDDFNPHMAARLLGAYESWRTLEPGRRALAQKTLERLASGHLSTDSFEIVSKTLGTA